MMKTTAHLLADTAAARPDRIAILDDTGPTTYATLAAHAGGVAAALTASGVGPGDRVAILLGRGAHVAASLFGTWASGAAALVMNDRLRPRQLQGLIADADPSVVISSEAHAGMLEHPRILAYDAFVPGPFRPAKLARTAMAELIYTSGSSGKPKGVVYPHGTILTGVEIVHAYLGLRDTDRIGVLPSLSSVYGLNNLLCGIRVGATLLLDNGVLAADVAASLRARQATVVASVPPFWLQLLAIPEFNEPIPSLRQIQNAGGHLPVELVHRLRAAQPQAALWCQYGMTETWRGTFLPPDQEDARAGSMGRAMPSADLHVLRPDGSECAPGEVGELVHAGPTVADGYWRAPEETARVFRPIKGTAIDRAVYSGDFVRRDAEGYFTFVGRRDRIIRTMGFRVGPDEISDVMLASGLVTDALVIGEPDEARGERIVAWVVLQPWASLAALRDFCRRELPSHMMPARFEVREGLPRLASGKYDLSAVRAGQ